MKFEDYRYFVNAEEIKFDKWLIEFRKIVQTDEAYDRKKQQAFRKIEQGINIFSWLYQREDLVLSIMRRDYNGYDEVLKLYKEKIEENC